MHYHTASGFCIKHYHGYELRLLPHETCLVLNLKHGKVESNVVRNSRVSDLEVTYVRRRGSREPLIVSMLGQVI